MLLMVKYGALVQTPCFAGHIFFNNDINVSSWLTMQLVMISIDACINQN